jgi:hypothetical protein
VAQEKSYWQLIVACWKLLLAALFVGLLSLGCVVMSVNQFAQFLIANQPLQAREVAFRAALYLLEGFANLWWLWRARWRPLPLVVLSGILCAAGLVVGEVSLVLFLAANRDAGYVIVALALLAAGFYSMLKCMDLIDRIKGQYFLWQHMDLIADMIKDVERSE